MIKETNKRSMFRSILWRVMGIIILALITYIFTGDLIAVGLITFLHHFVFIWVYYLHERVWQRSSLTGRKRKIARTITYEIILGNSILFLICILVGDVTGFVNKFTTSFVVTFTYIQNKIWVYVVYDYIWDKVKWETER